MYSLFFIFEKTRDTKGKFISINGRVQAASIEEATPILTHDDMMVVFTQSKS